MLVLQVELGTSTVRIEVQEAVVAALKLFIDPGLTSSSRLGFLRQLGQVNPCMLASLLVSCCAASIAHDRDHPRRW